MQELELRRFDDGVVVAEVESTCTANPFCGRDPRCPIKNFVTQCQYAINNNQGDSPDYFEMTAKAELKEDGIIIGIDGTLGIAYKCAGSRNEEGKRLEYPNGRVNIVRKPYLKDVVPPAPTVNEQVSTNHFRKS